MKSSSVKSSSKTSKSAAKSSPIKTKSDAAKTLHDLFVDGLKDVYGAEKALTKALPKMIKNTTDESLAEALTNHLEVTKTQVTRLEEVFSLIGEKAEAEKCEAMEGLIKEAEGIMEETEMGPVRDAGIIASGQKVEHYEIATYGTLAAFAKTLGEEDAASLLEETLMEEKEADEKLSEVAESSVNSEAAEA
jgi:ferritin-like metal-binding protein YciE